MTISAVLHGLTGNKVGLALTELHRAENDMATTLLALSDRHRTDHEVHHVARDIAGWSQEHVRRLAEVGRGYGLDLEAEPHGDPAPLAFLRQTSASLMRRLHEPTLLLLADLRDVHRKAAGTSLDWEVLAQSAQALRDDKLLGLASDCHAQTLRQLRWANSKVKEISAQAMVTG